MAGGRYLAISIESAELRYVNSDGKKITGWGAEPLTPGLVTDGLITDPKEMSATLTEFLKVNKFGKKKIVASVAGIRSLPRVLRLPKLAPKMIEEAVTYEADRQMPLPMSEMYVAYSMLENVDGDNQFFVIGVPRQRIENLVTSLELAPLKSYRLDLKSTALARAANVELGIIVDMEPTRIEIVVVLDSVPLITRTMIMTDPDIAPEDRMRRIAAEVDHTVAFHNANQPDNRIEQDVPVMLTGRLVADPDITREAGSAISHPIQALAPSLTSPGDFPSAEYAACIGMAVIARKKKEAKVSSKKKKGRSKGNVTSPALELLLTPANVPPHKSPTKFVLTAMLACLFFSMLFIVYRFDLDGAERSADLQFQLENVTLQLSDVQKTAKANSTAEIRSLRLEEETFELLGEQVSFVEDIDAIFNNIPAGVAPTNLFIRGEEISVEGFAATRTSAINYLGLIEETELFSAVNIASLSTIDSEAENPVMQFIISIER